MSKQMKAAPTVLPNDATKPTPLALQVNMEEDAGAGFEEAGKDSYAIPFLQLLQKGSPQIDIDHPKYKPLEGAKVGMMFNTVTEQLYSGDDGVMVLPCHFSQQYIEWAPRTSGGGFVKTHTVVDGVRLLHTTTRNDKNQDILPNGNYLGDSRSHYIIVLNPDGTSYPAVIALASTQLKKSKKWMSLMNGLKMKRDDGSEYTPPMWSCMYRVHSVAESNTKGTWRGWDFERVGPCPSPQAYAYAKAFRDAVRSGNVKTVDSAVTGDGFDAEVGF